MEACDLNATEARRLMAQKALSVTELAQSCIDRMNLVNHAVNAIICSDPDDLLKQAKKAQQAIDQGEPLGALHGLPLSVKDMVDLKGFPTTFGSTIFKDNMATSDDPMVAQLRSAGALPLGKTNNPEWSAGGNTRNAVYGVTANPFDVTRSAAGSSGGSAVALACGMTPLATGSDTGGSLRNPAAFCGVVGFRPSPGVVPGHTRSIGLIPLPSSGPMARSVEDIGLMLSEMIRPDRRDPWVPMVEGVSLHNASAYRHLPDYDLSSAKVAMTTDFGFAMTEQLIRESFSDKLAQFSSVFATCDDAHPNSDNADRVFAVLRALNFSGKHRDLMYQYPDQVGPNVKMNVEEGESYSALDVVEALEGQTTLYRHWQTFFEEYDFILAPTTTISPRDWHELYPTHIDGQPTQSYYHWLSMAYVSTLTGHPSLTLPVGRDKNNMPFGLQIIGRRGSDLSTLAFAKALEALLEKTPELARPRVDIATLSWSPALKEAEGFMGF
ncbi:amidase [Marinomonas transparens]|uniref:Amidase n=1 Tax=Marinomonas transparens TaxID=2795388 RepID=A0A934JMV4_9GAMM|nr:amidase family protein [Marinomonas transparens]MBJ7538726.1 amidase [Marinomonas transparens]